MLRFILLCFTALVILSADAYSGTHVCSASAMPQGFIVNVGQWPSEVLFAARTPSLNVYVTRQGMTYDRSTFEDVDTREAFRTAWTETSGATGVRYTPTDRTVSFFRGTSHLVARVAEKAVLQNVYNGIDVVYSMEGEKLRFDLAVAPNADISQCGLTWEGTTGIYFDKAKVLLKSDLIMSNLNVIQQGRSVDARFNVSATNDGTPAIRFEVPDYDSSLPLTIDPIVYGTYLGGATGDKICGIRLLPNGNLAVAGTTVGMSFPETVGRYAATVGGNADAFVAIMDKDLSKVLAYTYVGGSDEESARCLAVDGEGNVYVSGTTKSSNFPTLSGAAGQIYRAQLDVFVAKFNPTLTQLLVGTYISGNKDEWPTAMTVDVNSNIVVVGGTTSSANFPTNNGYQKVNGGQTDAFITRISSNGGVYQFSSYFGKSGVETFTSVAVDPTGAPYVTGSTTSSDFETAPRPGRFASNRVPYDRSYNGGNTDAFVIKFYTDGSLSSTDDGTYSTFFGGNADEEGRSIFVDALGRAYVVGVTTSTNLPAVGTLNTTNNGGKDIFMAVFSDDGRVLQGNTYFGKGGSDEPLVAVSLSGSAAIIGGYTTSTDYPNTGTGTTNERKGPTDGFLTFLNTSTNIYSDVIGGSGADTIFSIALDANQDVYLALNSTSMDLPVFGQSYQPTPGAQSIAYISKYAFGTLSLAVPRGGETYCNGQNVTLSWSALDMKPTDRFTVKLSTDDFQTSTDIASGLTASNYSWKPTGLAEGSSYKIRVSTERGHVSTTALPFSINAPPTIARQPVSVSRCLGQPASVSVEAAGSGLRYQWRRNGSNIPGATLASYEIAAVTATSFGKYDCAISGACTPAVTTASVDVGEATPTKITTQPIGKLVDKGASFTLAVVATGGNLSFQWSKDDASIDGATNASYTVASAQPADAGMYRCAVTGGCGDATSETAEITINPASSIDEDASVLPIEVLWPQPAADVLRMHLPIVDVEHVSVRILDVQGHEISRQRLTASSVIEINVMTLAAGSYMIEVSAGARTARSNFVVAR